MPVTVMCPDRVWTLSHTGGRKGVWYVLASTLKTTPHVSSPGEGLYPESRRGRMPRFLELRVFPISGYGLGNSVLA